MIRCLASWALYAIGDVAYRLYQISMAASLRAQGDSSYGPWED